MLVTGAALQQIISVMMSASVRSHHSPHWLRITHGGERLWGWLCSVGSAGEVGGDHCPALFVGTPPRWPSFTATHPSVLSCVSCLCALLLARPLSATRPSPSPFAPAAAGEAAWKLAAVRQLLRDTTPVQLAAAAAAAASAAKAAPKARAASKGASTPKARPPPAPQPVVRGPPPPPHLPQVAVRTTVEPAAAAMSAGLLAVGTPLTHSQAAPPTIPTSSSSADASPSSSSGASLPPSSSPITAPSSAVALPSNLDKSVKAWQVGHVATEHVVASRASTGICSIVSHVCTYRLHLTCTYYRFFFPSTRSCSMYVVSFARRG